MQSKWKGLGTKNKNNNNITWIIQNFETCWINTSYMNTGEMHDMYFFTGWIFIVYQINIVTMIAWSDILDIFVKKSNFGSRQWVALLNAKMRETPGVSDNGKDFPVYTLRRRNVWKNDM